MEIKWPHPEKYFDEQEEDVLLAQLVFGEARGEPSAARTGVAWTVRHRVENPKFPRILGGGKGWRGVILQPFQYSAFNVGDGNRVRMRFPTHFEPPEVWEACYLSALGVYRNEVPDPTGGADSYHDASMIHPPVWATPEKYTLSIGRLRFFRLYV